MSEPVTSHQKWVVGVVSAGLVAALSWAVIENYRLVQSRIDEQRVALQALTVTVGSHDRELAEVRANQRHIIETQTRIEEALARIEERLTRR